MNCISGSAPNNGEEVGGASVPSLSNATFQVSVDRTLAREEITKRVGKWGLNVQNWSQIGTCP